MSDAFIPKLGEDEARIIVLKLLFDANRGQLTASELKERFSVYREMSPDDLAPIDGKEGTPKFHHIVDNAMRRMNKNVGIYRSIYSEIIPYTEKKTVRITNSGRDFLRKYNGYVRHQKDAGFAEHTFFDESALDNFWNKLSAILKKANAPMTKSSFVNCLKSRRFAEFHGKDLESRGIFTKIGGDLSEYCKKEITSGNFNISKARPQAIDAWLHGRNEIDRYIDFIGI